MIKFRRPGQSEGSQYFEGKEIKRYNSRGNEYTYYIVDKVFIMDKYREGYIEVSNVFKGVEFLKSEIEILTKSINKQD